METGLLPATKARAPRRANIVAVVFEPAVTVTVAVLVMGLATAQGWAGIGHAAVALTLCALAPAVAMWGFSKIGLLESRWARGRTQRIVSLIAIVLIEAGAIWVLVVIGASGLLVGMLVSCLAGTFVLAALSPIVRASIHVGAITVIAGVMTQVVPVLSVVLMLLAVVVAVARYLQRDHSRAELVTGYVAGFLAGAGVAWLIIG